MSGAEAHYSATDIEERLLQGLREAGLDPEGGLSPADLGPLDHFHTGGLAATRELLEASGAEAGHRVLDIGAGLGGAARLIAGEIGCRVDCVELSPDYCVGARLLNRLTGLEDRIEIHQVSATSLPFPDATFDVVWMQNVGMNIEDKRSLYSEIRRVLVPGGRFAFQEMAAGATPTSYYPLPWASEPADNHLVTPDGMRTLLADCGLEEEWFRDTSEDHLGGSKSNAKPSTGSQLGLSIYVDNLGEKAKNARRSLEEGQVRLVRGVFRTQPA